MRKVKMLCLALLAIISLCACTNNNQTDAKKFKQEYESLNNTIREKDGKTIRSIEISEYNPIIYKEASEIASMIDNKETFVVYFGFNDCPWCRSVLPTLLSVANDLNLDKIYYVDVKEIRDVISVDTNNSLQTTTAGSEGYYTLISRLNNVLSDYKIKDNEGNQVSAGEKRIYAPNVVSIINGIPTDLTTGISSKQTDGYMPLTDEMNKETYDMFVKVLKSVADGIEACTDKGC